MEPKITIIVDVDGNSISREYHYTVEYPDYETWGKRVEDMIDTIEHSKDNKF